MERAAIVLLPHQDDEVFLYPTLMRLKKNGVKLRIIYLTDGTYHGTPSNVRNMESLNALNAIGINVDSVLFLGSEFGIVDGKMSSYLKKIWQEVIRDIGSSTYDSIYCPAFEGGHQDHDCCNIFATELAKTLGIVNSSWQFYLYTAEGAFWKFFRVFRPEKVTRNDQVNRLSFKEAFLTFKAIFYFKSQTRSWLGLLPEFFIRLVFIRKEVLSPLKKIPPMTYKSKPLYSRWGRVDSNEVIQACVAFVGEVGGASSGF